MDDHVTTRWLEPPHALQLDNSELHIWRVSLTQSAACRRDLESLLSPDETERAGRFVFQRHRDQFIVARGLLRRLLAAYLATSPAELRFRYATYGKPLLSEQAGQQDISFNLAHSGALALYALAVGRSVGIDLERTRDELDYTSLLSNVFSPREQDALQTLPATQRRRAFYQGWVCKEAYLKARGSGLAYPPDRVEIALVGGAAVLKLPPEEHSRPWRLNLVDAGAGYAAAVVADGGPAALRYFDAGDGTAIGVA